MITEFARPSSIDEAVTLGKKGYVFLAGGTQVNNGPFRKWGHRVERVASLDRLRLAGIESDADTVRIGAMATLQEVADHAAVPEALREAARFIPTRSVRNIATIGGNIGANRPDSYVIPALIALAAEVETKDGALSVEEYVTTEGEDLILAIRIPAVTGVCRAVKESRSHLSLPVVSAAVRVAIAGNTDAEVIVAAGCVGPHSRRLIQTERVIREGWTNANGSVDSNASPASFLSTLEETISQEVTPTTDILGGEAYKRYVNGVVIADLVRRCIEEVSS